MIEALLYVFAVDGERLKEEVSREEFFAVKRETFVDHQSDTSFFKRQTRELARTPNLSKFLESSRS
jgi:hypothetical protein